MKSTQFSKNLTIIVNFTVNATGGVEKVALKKSTDLKEIDDLLMDLIKNMPAWNAAKTADGEPTH
jgi:outer membrane biosynthesis protein TonB